MTTNSKFCSLDCLFFSRRKVKRPTPEQLIADRSTMSWSLIGKKYHVSDMSVRKWARSYNIPTR